MRSRLVFALQATSLALFVSGCPDKSKEAAPRSTASAEANEPAEPAAPSRDDDDERDEKAEKAEKKEQGGW